MGLAVAITIGSYCVSEAHSSGFLFQELRRSFIQIPRTTNPSSCFCFIRTIDGIRNIFGYSGSLSSWLTFLTGKLCFVSSLLSIAIMGRRGTRPQMMLVKFEVRDGSNGYCRS
ncbi:uncharacterized protein LY89DRAFT_442755 [Mollisia scopiformis]|uniref:Uncharacterized protein n=1 Tax=Mollisia scopiformis TaxID=149040 RepID=A0A194XJS3_MOLSC|nr:uncharacterized protein LY89DRAFT_442755 [Mollisia scopiformis]KUJ20408.1 hypothetical protein LY89DRAFT_442755 [Mollisia scopiformis]